MLYAFELSGEHEELPRAEVLACLDIVGAVYSEHAFFDQCLIVDIDGSDEIIDKKMELMAERLYFSHYNVKVVGLSDTDIDKINRMAFNWMEGVRRESPQTTLAAFG